MIVDVADEESLVGLASRALERDIAITTWHEPDMGHAATALALAPGDPTRRLCSSLPLHGKRLVTV